jgi:hypothetical protein
MALEPRLELWNRRRWCHRVSPVERCLVSALHD